MSARPVTTACRLPDPDRAYRALIEAHRSLDESQSAMLNTRLVLILANHIGDADVLADAIALARRADLSEPSEDSEDRGLLSGAP